MKPSNNRQTITSALSHRSTGKHCRHWRNPAFPGPIRTVVDDAGLLAITAWTCALCGDLVEEIRMLSRDGTSRLYPIHDAITPLASGRRSAGLSGVW